MPETIGTDGRLKDRTGIAPQGGACRLYKTAAQSVTSSTWTLVTWDTKEFDPYNWFDAATNRFKPTTPGYYRVSAQLIYKGLGATNTEIDTHIRKNGVGGPGLTYEGGLYSSQGAWGTSTANTIVYLNGTTDYVDVVAWAGTAGSLAVSTDSYKCTFNANLFGTSVGVIPEPWHVVGAAGEPSFQNGWAGYNSGLAFCKMPDGTVRLKGETLAGTWTTGTPIFTLPVGYRPAWRHYFSVYMDSAPNVGVVNVQTNGEVQTEVRAGTATHIHGFGAVSFRAEQ